MGETFEGAAKPFNSLYALLMSEILSVLPEVKNIEFFGSLARDSKGNDFDIILIVDEALSETFLSEANAALRKIFRPGLAKTRLEVAKSILGEQFQVLVDYMQNTKPGVAIDVFLFPEDWRNRLDELQVALPHRDKEFMKHLAHDARSI